MGALPPLVASAARFDLLDVVVDDGDCLRRKAEEVGFHFELFVISMPAHVAVEPRRAGGVHELAFLGVVDANFLVYETGMAEVVLLMIVLRSREDADRFDRSRYPFTELPCQGRV